MSKQKTTTRNSMNNHLPQCGLVDARIRASDKDLPVFKTNTFFLRFVQYIFNHTIRKCENMTRQNTFQILLLNGANIDHGRRTLGNKNENAKKCLISKGHIFGILSILLSCQHYLKAKAWVATVFWVARTHLARPDLGAHAHVCAPPI